VGLNSEGDIWTLFYISRLLNSRSERKVEKVKKIRLFLLACRKEISKLSNFQYVTKETHKLLLFSKS
jgi:hypothetical protein